MTPIFEDVLRALLIEADIAGTRVFLMRAPQAPADQMKTPYVVYQNVGVSALHSLRVPLDVLDRLYQVSIFDKSQSVALGLADALRSKFDGFRGDYLGIRFGGIFYRAQTATVEFEPQLYHVIVDFRIVFQYLDSFEALNRSHATLRSKTK